MENKGQVINPSSMSVDAESKTDEINVVAGESGKLDIIQGKRSKGVTVNVNGGTVFIKPVSKFLWTTDNIKIKDRDGNRIKVESTKEGFCFAAEPGATYLVTVAYKFRTLILLIAIVALIGISGPFIFGRQSEPAKAAEAPIGNYTVGGKQEKKVEEEPEEDIPTITFSGYGKYTVSAEVPNVEVSNPENNFVNMQFTLIDNFSGDVIARTDLVSPGNYAYVNVMDYYKDRKGEFNVTVEISTFSPEGQAMNGMVEDMVLTVE